MTAIFDQPPTLVASDHSQVSPATTAIESPRDYRRSSMLSDSSALYSTYANSSSSLGPATPENATFPYDHRRSFAAERDAKDRASDNHAPSFPFSSSLDNHSNSTTLPYPISVGMSYPYSNGLHSTVPRQPTVARSATSDSLPSYQPHPGSSLHTGARPLVSSGCQNNIHSVSGYSVGGSSFPPASTAVLPGFNGRYSYDSNAGRYSMSVPMGNGGVSAENDLQFVSLAGPVAKKRSRRRYDEIERIYPCGYKGCDKAYGTLNHLNAHVAMQKHGEKRLPAEFKEMRKEWRKKKREEAAAAANKEAAAAAAAANEAQSLPSAGPYTSSVYSPWGAPQENNDPVSNYSHTDSHDAFGGHRSSNGSFLNSPPGWGTAAGGSSENTRPATANTGSSTGGSPTEPSRFSSSYLWPQGNGYKQGARGDDYLPSSGTHPHSFSSYSMNHHA